MRTQNARRLASWSAAIAILMASAVAGVYLHRAYLARRERALAPPAIPSTVTERSAAFSISPSNGNRTTYTIRAANATQYKEGNRTKLEDVWITAYGDQGDRNDTIRTMACDYISPDAGNSSGGRMTCAGDVEIDLESAAEAKSYPSAANGVPSVAAHVLHVTTSNLTFEQSTGIASTDRVASFRFPGGAGKATGVRFDSKKGDLNLAHDVEIEMEPQSAAAGGEAPAGNPTTIRGQSMVYHHDDGVAHLIGAAQIQNGASVLDAQEIALDLDDNFHPRRALASGTPVLHETDPQRQITSSAGEFTALFTPDGTISRVSADGNVHATSQSRGEHDEFAAAHAQLEIAPSTGQPRLLTASGGTKGNMRIGATTRKFATDALQVTFTQPTEPHQSAQPELVHTLAPATVDWIAPASATKTSLSANGQAPAATTSAPSAMQTTHMSGQTFDIHYATNGRVDHLTGTGGVEVDQDSGDAGTRTSTSQTLDAHFDDAGNWTTVDQSGRVHYRDAQGTADADRAHMDSAADTATLAGSIVLTDPNSRTTAQSATFAHNAGEMRAEGRVITAELSNAANGTHSVANFSDQPARISADHLIAERAAGEATYTGHARLWQGECVMQADSIELDHPAQTLTAIGHVHAVFPAAAWKPATQGGAAQSSADPAPKPTAAKTSSSSSANSAAPPPAPDLWHAQGGRLTYWSQKSFGRLEQNASADSQEASMRAPSIDFNFAPTDPAKPSGAQQLVSAVATGGVTVRQLDRRGTSQRADYTVAERKFVLSGGPPVLRDDSGNSTTGRQLTFIFADDRIVVDSEEGTRTLTLHRVEK